MVESAYLKGSTCQNESISRRVILIKRLAEFRLDVLHPMSLVYNHVDPLDFREQQSLLNHILVGG